MAGKGSDMTELFGTSSPDIHTAYTKDADFIILTGDAATTLKEIPSGTVRLIISSPPYNIGKEYEKGTALDSYLESMKPILGELARIVSDNGSICWQVGNYVDNGEIVPLDISYYPIFRSLGFKLRNRIIWHFDHGLHASKRFSGRYETICWFTKSDNYVFNLDPVRVPSKYPGKTHFKGKKRGLPSGNPLGKNPSDFWTAIEQDWDRLIWEIPNVKANHPEKTIHPCQYPVELVQRCILALTNEGDYVLDPFGGVGSAMVAAMMHNRKAIICEKEAKYVEIAVQRIKDFANGSLKIRPLGKPVHTPSGREKVSQMPLLWQEQKETGSK
jgi:adenine-specific DNA-methyltransferase